MLLHEIPRIAKFLDSPTKLVRHRGDQWDLNRLLEVGQLEDYQAHQHRPVFHNCRYILSFMGEENGHSRFVGAYEKTGVRGPDFFQAPDGFLYPEMYASDVPHFLYEFTKLPGLEDLEGRLVIQWGKAHLSWHQRLYSNPGKAKEIVEISPPGYVKAFPGYEDFTLSFRELKRIIKNPVANREWRDPLKSVAGIYLISVADSGRQYVGSAYGEQGIWGRWTTYVRTNGHGNNKLLIELLDKDSDAADRFQFTILRTLPRTMAKKRVIEFESLYKAKLGTRAHGLNIS